MDDATLKYHTREDWLLAAVEEFRPWFKDAGKPLPARVRVSCGFALGSRKAIGQAWNCKASSEGLANVFISPILENDAGDKSGVLPTLLHELCHVALPEKTGHRAPFAKLAASLGLDKPWTATTPSPDCLKRLNDVRRVLGKYPHGRLNPSQLERKKQSTRLLKAECEECGYIVRVTAKWVEEAGPPRCGIASHGAMAVDGE